MDKKVFRLLPNNIRLPGSYQRIPPVGSDQFNLGQRMLNEGDEGSVQFISFY